MITDRNAKRLKRIEIKVFHPGNKTKRTMVFRPNNGSVFLAMAIDQLLGRICAEVDQAFPGEEYKMVTIGPASFNFVHQGKAKEVA
jgi:hypothetical protein